MKDRRAKAWLVFVWLCWAGCGGTTTSNDDASASDGAASGSSADSGATRDVSSSGAGATDADPPIDGGPRGGGGDAQTDAGTAVSSCGEAADCAGNANGKTICNVPLGRCDECIAAIDCGKGGACVDFRCESRTPCDNSLDCPSGEICDTTVGTCFECVADADCNAGEVCAESACYTACDSDNDCTPAGLLCNFDSGHCAHCTVHADCSEAQHCNGTRCAADVCEPSTVMCVSGAVVSCTEVGDELVGIDLCLASEGCVEAGGTASCMPLFCTPGADHCYNGDSIRCSDNGVTIEWTIDCAMSDQACQGGLCRDTTCEPGTYFCDGDTRRACTLEGTASAIDQACSGRCDATIGACVSGSCAANEPACNGTVATTCNATGDGYLPGGTDCADTSQVCVAGTCGAMVCTPNAFDCDGEIVRRCNSTGTGWFAEDYCSVSEYCASDGTCQDRVCAPNELFCPPGGGYVARCDAAGSEYAVEEMCPTNERCDPDTLTCSSDAPCTCTNSCFPIGVIACCKADGTCGCTWAPGAFCS